MPGARRISLALSIVLLVTAAATAEPLPTTPSSPPYRQPEAVALDHEGRAGVWVSRARAAELLSQETELHHRRAENEHLRAALVALSRSASAARSRAELVWGWYESERAARAACERDRPLSETPVLWCAACGVATAALSVGIAHAYPGGCR